MRYLIIFLFSNMALMCSQDQSGSSSEPMMSKKAEYSEGRMESDEMLAEAGDMSNSSEQGTNNQSTSSELKNEKIIKDGFMSVDVADLKKSKLDIDQKLSAHNAYYESENYNSSNYQSTYNLKIRIPAKSFESFVQDIEAGDGKITSKNVNARDVTEEYFDVKSRMETGQAYLKQYQELLTRAKTIKEILEIQEKIRRIEEEIDARKGRLKFMDDRVMYSTLNLNLVEKHERIYEKPRRNFFTQLANSIKSGFDIFLNFLLLLVRLWPFVLLFVLLWIFRGRIRNPFRRRK